MKQIVSIGKEIDRLSCLVHGDRMCHNLNSQRDHVVTFHLGVDFSRGDSIITEACVCIVVLNAIFTHGFVAIGAAFVV